MKLQKVGRLILFVAFFLCLHFLLHFWVTDAGIFSTACNSGGPFGITISKWLFIPVFFGALVFLVVQWWGENSFSSEWPWLIIFSGGLANLLERFFFGCITDYISFWSFPVFNVADVLLTIGVIGVLMKNDSAKCKNV